MLFGVMFAKIMKERKRTCTLLTKNTKKIGRRNPSLCIFLSCFKVPNKG